MTSWSPVMDRVLRFLLEHDPPLQPPGLTLTEIMEGHSDLPRNGVWLALCGLYAARKVGRQRDFYGLDAVRWWPETPRVIELGLRDYVTSKDADILDASCAGCGRQIRYGNGQYCSSCRFKRAHADELRFADLEPPAQMVLYTIQVCGAPGLSFNHTSVFQPNAAEALRQLQRLHLAEPDPQRFRWTLTQLGEQVVNSRTKDPAVRVVRPRTEC